MGSSLLFYEFGEVAFRVDEQYDLEEKKLGW
jgi:hypothetical protein